MRILAICGSLRKASWTRKSLEALAALAPPDCEIEVYGLEDIPIFDQDEWDEHGFPPAVAKLRAAVLAADGIILGTPEYFHSFSGAIKNALDWAGGKPAVFAGKPAAVMSAAPSVHGGSRSQYDLRKVLVALECLVLARPELFVGQADRKFDAAGAVTDEKTAAAMTDFVAALRDWIVRMQSSTLAPSTR